MEVYRLAEGKKLGEWAFIIGVLIAIVIGLFSSNIETKNPQLSGWLIAALVLLGLVVGLMNITEKETTPFLIAAIALLATGSAAEVLNKIPTIGLYLTNVVKQIGVFVSPAAIVVALKAIQSLAKD